MTVDSTAEVDSTSDGVGQTSEHTAWWHPSGEMLLAVLGLGLMTVGMLVEVPVLVVIGASVSGTVICLEFFGWDLALITACLGFLLLSIALGTAAELLNTSLLRHPGLIGCSEVLVGILAIFVAFRRGQGARRRPVASWDRVAFMPACAAGVVGLAQSLCPSLAASWSLLGTDIAEHTVYLGRVQSSGKLDYATSGYPQGFHFALGLLTEPATRAFQGGELLRQDLVLMSSMVWLTLAVFLWAAAAVTLRLATRYQIPPLTARVAAGLVGWVLLTLRPFQVAFVHMGAVPSLFAVVALWSIPLSGLPRRGALVTTRNTILACILAVTLVAQLWQALALAPLFALIIVLLKRGTVGMMRIALRVPLREQSRRVSIAAAAVVIGCLSIPPILGALKAGGIAHAGVPGDTSGVPLALDVVGAVALLGFFARVLDDHGRRLWGGTAIGLLAVELVLLVGAGHGLNIQQYYPMKGIWFLLLFCSPVIALGLTLIVQPMAVRGWRLVGRFPAIRIVGRAGIAASILLAFAGLVGPGLIASDSMVRAALRGDDHGSGARRLSTALEYGTRYAPSVVVPVALGLTYSPVQYGPYIISKLLTFQTGQQETFGAPAQVCADVRRVSAIHSAVVLTDLPPALLKPYMLRGGCGSTRVVQVSDADKAVVQWYSKALVEDAKQLGETSS